MAPRPGDLRCLTNQQSLHCLCACLSLYPPVVYSELPALWGQDHLLFPFYTAPGTMNSIWGGI